MRIVAGTCDVICVLSDFLLRQSFILLNNLTLTSQEKLKNLLALWTSYFQAQIASY